EKVIGMLADKHRMMNLPRERAPADLVTHVMEKIERSTLLHDVDVMSQPRRSWWQSRLATTAAAAIMIGGFGWLVVHTLVKPCNDWEHVKKSQTESRKLAPSTETPHADAPVREATKATAGTKDLKDAVAAGAPAAAPTAASPERGKARGADADKE